MGYRRPLAALLSTALIGATGGDSLPLREARWIAPDARLEMLSAIEVPCIAEASPDMLYGFIAFEDPLLLGGQAARAGLSCASCHRGGRGNEAFIFPGVSGAPGTADITSSIFSHHRGDFIENPVTIANLTFDRPKISHDKPGELEAFIRGQIVEEFDGAEPAAAIVSSLAKFIRALEPSACKPSRPRSFFSDFARYTLALEMAQTALQLGDREVSLAMLRAARSRLGLIAERFTGEDSSPAMTALTEADDAVAALQTRVRDGGEIMMLAKAMRARIDNAITWSAPLQLAEDQSLYSRDRLAEALSAPRTP